jgi:hypothetical protein
MEIALITSKYVTSKMFLAALLVECVSPALIPFRCQRLPQDPVRARGLMIRAELVSRKLSSLAVVNVMIYMSTSTRLTPGGSSTVHMYTQSVHITTQITTEQHKITTNLEEWRSCPVFASVTLVFALQLRKKHGKTSVRVAEEENASRKGKF